MKIYKNSIGPGAVVRLLLCGLFLSPMLHAQQVEEGGMWQFGIHGAAVIGSPSASFNALPGVQNCLDSSGSFDGGSGGGFVGGVAARYIPMPGAGFMSNIGYSLRLGYSQGATEFTASEKIGSASDEQGRIEPVMADYIVETTIQTLLIEPTAHYRVSSVNLNLGLSIGYTLGGSFTQREKLVSPSDAQYIDGTTERNINDGTFASENLSALRTGLTIGAGYEIPITPLITLIPEVSYLVALGSPVKDVDWNPNEIRAGISLLFSPAPLISNPLEPGEK
jgi:hypothetical protein